VQLLRQTTLKSILNEADIIEPEGARGGVVRVDDYGGYVGSRPVGGGHPDPIATGSDAQVNQGDHGAVGVMTLQHPDATRVAGTTKGAEAVGLARRDRDRLAG